MSKNNIDHNADTVEALWYTLRVPVRYEEFVVKGILDLNIQAIKQVIAPSYTKTIVLKNNKTSVRKLQHFPGFVFIQMQMRKEIIRQIISNFKFTVYFLSSINYEPIPSRHFNFDNLKNVTNIVVGSKVFINKGNFSGKFCVVTEINGNLARINLPIMGKNVSFDISLDYLKLV